MLTLVTAEVAVQSLTMDGWSVHFMVMVVPGERLSCTHALACLGFPWLGLDWLEIC